MGWKGVTVMDQRIRFLSDYLEGPYPFTEPYEHFGISRKTGYKWVGRYREYGVEGPEERSRRPHSCPHETDDKSLMPLFEPVKNIPVGIRKNFCGSLKSSTQTGCSR
jgi:hypothetical protein